MAATPIPKIAKAAGSQATAVQPHRIAVATSGGLDSIALLHCTLQQAAALHAADEQQLTIEVFALHVHHGLMPEADSWLQQVQRLSKRWGAHFDSRRLSGQPAKGDSIEAWARQGRYAALTAMAIEHGCSTVLLAHHRRDQAETFLLQALRGAGAAGLASMPALAQRGGITWLRPWLNQPREAVAAYAKRHRLRFVEDSSNADPRFARSRMRTTVWPVLQHAFADLETALTSAAQRAQEAAQLAAEAAAADLPALQDGQALRVDALRVLQQHAPGRCRNALQAWLATQLPQAAVPGSLVVRLLQELPRAAAAEWPAPGGVLKLYRGRLAWLAGASSAVPSAPLLSEPPFEPAAIDLSQPGKWQPAEVHGGYFEVQQVRQGGAPAQLLQDLVLHPRSGGERFAFGPNSQARSLKKQYQAAAVPAWQRHGPLLSTTDGRLVFAPGLGLNAWAQAQAGSPRLSVVWRPEGTR
jgi:tRNA(Ile)-lysidine synthase